MDAARYAIEIAAQMTGQEQTNAELDELTAKLSGNGKGAEHFQLALKMLAGDMDNARLATQAAADALALGQEEYKGLESAAVQATKAAEAAARAIAVRDDTAVKAQAAAAAVVAYAEQLNLLKAAAGAAGGADEAANAALAAGLGKYQKLEAAAAKSARAAEKAAAKSTGLIPEDLAAQASAANAAVDSYASTLKRLERESAGAAAHEEKLGQQLANVKKLAGHVDKSLTGNSEGLAKTQGALSAMGGPLGSLGSRIIAPIKGFADLTQGMGMAQAAAVAGAVGFAAVAAAVAAVTVAAVAGVVAIARWAVGLADANRAAGLTRAAAEAVTPELAALHGEIDAIANDTGQSVTALNTLEKTLRGAHVAAADMPAALRAAALAETALGQGGSAQFVADLQSGRKSVAALAKDTQTKLGGIVAQQMRGLDAQSARLKQNIGGLFGSLNVDPALNGMQTIVGIFDKTTASGQALQFFFDTIFQPLIDQSENAGYAVEAFVLGFEKSALQMYIGAKPMLKVLGFGDTKLENTLDAAAKAGEYFAVAVVAAAGVLTVIGVAIGAVVVTAEALFLVGLSPLIAAFYACKTAGMALYDAIAAIPRVFAAVKAAIPGPGEWLGIGQNVVLGIAQGITGAAGAVLSAIGGVVSGAISSAKRALGIASPSKVFGEIGDFTGQGFAGGVEDATPAAQAAMTDMVTPSPAVLSQSDALGGAIDVPASPLAGLPKIDIQTKPASADGSQPSAPGGKPGKGPAPMDLSGASFNFYGVKDAADAVDRFGEMLTRVLEGDALSLGEAAPG